MQVGLLFGSFNPIHIGHLAIAGYVLEFTRIQEVWLVVSPHNPLKDKTNLAPEHHRLEMVKLAVSDYPNIMACDVEMHMPQPSYTIDTVCKLKENFPTCDFTVIMGADSLESITKWRDYQKLISENRILVYPRIGQPLEALATRFKVETINAPIIEMSSTFIRNTHLQRKCVKYFMPHKAYTYMIDNKLYK